jgi:flavin-dependent dehydrogenase
VLDALLVDAARAADATVVHGPRVVDLLRGADGRVLGVVAEERDGTVRQLRAGIVIGADGRRSIVAHRVGAAPYRIGTHAAAVIYGYWPGVAVAGYEWMFTPQVTGGAIPTNDGDVCLFVACPPARFLSDIRRDLEVGYFRLFSEVSPALLDVVSTSTAAVKLRGYPGEPGYVRQSVGRGWALVGDAGYFKDPITAHGITDAFRDAELLSHAVLTGSERALAEYQTMRDDLSQGMFAITDEIASFSWSMTRVRELHHEMSRELNREAERLAASSSAEALAGGPRL